MCRQYEIYTIARSLDVVACRFSRLSINKPSCMDAYSSGKASTTIVNLRSVSEATGKIVAKIAVIPESLGTSPESIKIMDCPMFIMYSYER